MQNQEIEMAGFVPIAVPLELLEEAGIYEDDVLQFSVVGRKIVVEAYDGSGDFICDGDCETCPMSEIVDCEDDCEYCPCVNNCDESEAF